MKRIWFYVAVAVGVAFNFAFVYGIYCLLRYFFGDANEALFWMSAYIGIAWRCVYDYMHEFKEVK